MADQSSRQASINNEDFGHDLTLSLSPPSSTLTRPPPPVPLFHPPPEPELFQAAAAPQPPSPPPQPPVRLRRAAVQPSDDDPIFPPFAWATDRRANVHSLDFLLARGITVITGEVQCKKCERRQVYELDLKSKFMEIASFIVAKKGVMHDRAPDSWTSPELPPCALCGPNCLKPVMPENKDEINWLFLLLGQMLGLCTLEQLKYFCRYTRNHRTGAKDRVLYLTYLELCKQLDPDGPFDR